ATLARIRPGTPAFVPAGNRRLTTRLGAATKLRVVEVPRSVPVKLDDAGGRLAFVTGENGRPTTSSVVISVDRVALLGCAPTPPNGAHVHDSRSTVGDRFDVVAVQVARPTRDPLCLEGTASVLRRRSAHLRAAALDDACAVVRAAQARVVIPYGGPPCFL